MLYEPKTLAKIGEEAAKDGSVFSLNDRLGLVYDSVALSKAGLAQVSSALTLMDILGKTEKECESILGWIFECVVDGVIVDLVWSGIADNLSALVSTWWENQDVVDQLNAVRGVGNTFQSSYSVFTHWILGLVCSSGQEAGL